MAETSQQIDIPNRALFKAAEVCDLVKVQPYVLRSWEAEFKDLGVTRSGSAARVYRREDVERVLRIKHLLLVEGLTLAGVRRKLEEEAEPPLDQTVVPHAPAQALAGDTRERIGQVRQGLRSLLDLLDASSARSATSIATADFALEPPETAASTPAKSTRRSTTKERPVAANDGEPRTTSPRRTRSA